MKSHTNCRCAELGNLAVIGMGSEPDEEVLGSLDLVSEHGGLQWWLYMSRCNQCQQFWMIAQEERVHDNFCLKRIDAEDAARIVTDAIWPEDFLEFGAVLRLERECGQVAHFLDPNCHALVATAHELKRKRPDITSDEIGYLLAIRPSHAARLLAQKP
ncbi:hypothetical protein [Novosphingobium sp. CCH12-A3]|uniref:hypothetical protein n=1 Tax=Novosphingobium sp. CCH12-A3 TaxID=1768752 RepID=UPI000A728322|nr:hypothetical protein [Novosphingobium sp. CCH12-A3]